MMQIWLYDKNKVFTKSIFVDEMGENMTTVPLTVGYVKPIFNGTDWVEGATEEEIKEWEEANKPQPQEPSKTDILSKEVEELKAENKLLNAQVNALSTTTDFHEDLIAEMAMLVYA